MPTSPRRRRSSTPPQKSGGGWAGTIALGLGVIVAGLGIGALLAAFHQRGLHEVTVAEATSPPPIVTPLPEATRGPVAIATIAPPHTPRPSPSPSPSEEPSPSPSPHPSPKLTPTPSATDAPTSGPATPAPIIAAEVRPTVTPPPVRPSAVPPPPKPVESASLPPIVAGTSAPIAGTAASLVRRYLEALIHGDEAAGYTALGGESGDPGLTLSEEAFLDASARLTSVRTTSADANSALVEAEIATGKGTFYATYHIAYGKHGAYIASHDYIKV